MPRNKYPNPVKARREAAARWRHFAMIGSVAMSQAQMRAIVDSPSATDASKEIANRVLEHLRHLKESLKERVDV